MRSQLSPYSPGPFHITRAFLWISTLIVTSIMVYFAINLHSSGFKFPYAFLLILITCILTLLNLLFTTLLYCRNSLRPLLSLIMSFILFVLWALSLGFLGYSMRGTLHTSCNTASWGTSTGILVCRLYKVLFSFMVVALVFTFIHIVIDAAARRDRASRASDYGSMQYQEDYKMHARGESAAYPLAASAADAPDAVPVVEGEHRARADAYNAMGTVRQEDTRYNMEEQEHQYHRQHQQEENDYYDGIPDLPPASGVRWAQTASPYSPLQNRFEQQEQTGYEAYRPHRTAYDDGYRG